MTFFRSRSAVLLTACVLSVVFSGCLPVATPQDGYPSAEYWYAIGRCEQPGDGFQGIDWTVRGPGYVGGLGISTDAWLENRGPEMPENGGDASPAQQIEVARRIFAYAGAGAWGCSSVAGPPY